MRMPGLAIARRSLPTRPTVSLRLGHVDGDEVGLLHEALEAEELDAELAGPVGRDVRVVGHDPHPEPVGPLRHEPPDPPEADDAEDLVGQLDALPPRPLPAPGHEGGVGLGDVAGLGQQEGHRVLRRREHVRLRRVDHHHAPAGGRLDVDVVEADARPAHHHQLGRGVQDVGRDLRGRADDEGVRVLDRLEQLLRGEPEPDVHVVAGRPQAVQSVVGDLFGDEHPGHRAMLVGLARRGQPGSGRTCRHESSGGGGVRGCGAGGAGGVGAGAGGAAGADREVPVVGPGAAGRHVPPGAGPVARDLQGDRRPGRGRGEGGGVRGVVDAPGAGLATAARRLCAAAGGARAAYAQLVQRAGVRRRL